MRKILFFMLVGLLSLNFAQAEDFKVDKRGYNKSRTKSPEGYPILVKELSDEFNGRTLDLKKWRNESGRGGWAGRGADYRRDNTFVKDGLLHLKSSVIGTDEDLKKLYMAVEELYVPDEKLRYGDKLDPNTWDPMNYGLGGWKADWGADKDKYNAIMEQGLKTIGAANLISKRYGSCGYYEARIKVSGISLSSAFWLQGGGIEFDITETIGGYSINPQGDYVKSFPYKIGTSVWVNTPEHRGKGGIPAQHTKHSELLREKFIVLGLKWEPTKLTVYINDKEVYNFPLENRTTKEGNIPIPVELFTNQQQVIFDTEMLLGPDTGWPTKKQLEDETINTFYVDWVRVWVKEGTEWVKSMKTDRVKDNPKDL